MIATGLQLWVIKRRGNATKGLYRRIEGLNVMAVLGLPLAMASYFWANRLLPDDLLGREIREIQAFFCVWLLTLLHAQIRAPRHAWREQALLCALGFAGLPILDFATGPDALNGFNGVSLLLAIGFAYAAWRLYRAPAKLGPAPRSTATSSRPRESRT